MLEKASGKVSYAVLSFGGFLGIGDDHYPLPWQTLTYDTSVGGYRVNLTRDQLDQAPRYGRTESWDWEDRSRATALYNIPWAAYSSIASGFSNASSRDSNSHNTSDKGTARSDSDRARTSSRYELKPIGGPQFVDELKSVVWVKHSQPSFVPFSGAATNPAWISASIALEMPQR